MDLFAFACKMSTQNPFSTLNNENVKIDANVVTPPELPNRSVFQMIKSTRNLVG